MKNKKVLLIAVVAVLLVMVVGLCIFIFSSKKSIYEQFPKYSLAIAIDAKTKNGLKSHLVDVSYDGENARVSSSDVGKDSYIIGERIYYLEDDTFYWYTTTTSYLDVYRFISRLDKLDFVKDVKDGKEYITVLKSGDVNDILDALFIEKDTKGSAKATVVLSDRRVSKFNLVIDDVDGYDEVTINVSVSELESDYKVNTSRIFGGTGGGRRYKMDEALSNIFKIID